MTPTLHLSDIRALFFNVLEPEASRLGFIKRDYPNEPHTFYLTLNSFELSVSYTLRIQTNRRGSVVLSSGQATFASAFITTFCNRLKTIGIIAPEYNVPCACIKHWDHPDELATLFIRPEHVLASTCSERATAIAQSLLPKIASITTIADLNNFLNEKGTDTSQVPDYNQVFFYLCVAYFARNPQLNEIQNCWIAFYDERHYIDATNELATICYMRANPLR
jgi:hypothetical protein